MSEELQNLSDEEKLKLEDAVLQNQSNFGIDEKLIPFDPKQVEADMIAAAQARSEDPTETAAGVYHMYLPHYKRIMPKLSTRSLRRVMNYMVMYPFHMDDVKPTSEIEKEVMLLVSSLVEAKLVMIMDTYRQHAEQLYEASQTELTEEQKQEIQKDIDNQTSKE